MVECKKSFHNFVQLTIDAIKCYNAMTAFDILNALTA